MNEEVNGEEKQQLQGVCFLMYFSLCFCECVCSCSDRVQGGESRGGSIVGLCVAQIVLFSGKVETQHSSPEVWLPGERGGKKRGRKKAGKRWEGELHRCGERNRNGTAGRKDRDILGMGAGKWERPTDEHKDRMKKRGSDFGLVPQSGWCSTILTKL